MRLKLPSDSKVAILSIAAMEIAFTVNGCNHNVQLVGLAAASGLGGFTLGAANGSGSGSSKSSE